MDGIIGRVKCGSEEESCDGYREEIIEKVIEAIEEEESTEEKESIEEEE